MGGATDGEQHPHGGDWLRDALLGLNDGLVTSLVFVMTLGGIASDRQVLVAGALAEVFAGGVSMAFGAFLAARTQDEVIQKRIAVERHEIATEPEEEREELRRIYRAKGFTGSLLGQIVAHQTATPDRWLKAMMRDEHGLVDEQPARSPLTSGLWVGSAFVVGAAVPVLPVFLPVPLIDARILSFALAAAVGMLLGVLKSRYTLKGPLRSALELLFLAVLGALFGYGMSRILHLG